MGLDSETGRRLVCVREGVETRRGRQDLGDTSAFSHSQEEEVFLSLHSIQETVEGEYEEGGVSFLRGGTYV